MAFRNKEGMAISYDCEKLIAELKADIAEFGEDEDCLLYTSPSPRDTR